MIVDPPATAGGTDPVQVGFMLRHNWQSVSDLDEVNTTCGSGWVNRRYHA